MAGPKKLSGYTHKVQCCIQACFTALFWIGVSLEIPGPSFGFDILTDIFCSIFCNASCRLQIPY